MIKLSRSYISKNEIDNVSRILKKQFLGMGPEVKKFENELSNIFGRSAICVVNGTAAIQANTISSTELVSAVTLEIKDSGGSTVKTIIGAGS